MTERVSVRACLWRCTIGGNVSLQCALGSAVMFYGVRFNLNYCWVAKWLSAYLPVEGSLLKTLRECSGIDSESPPFCLI